MKKMTVRNWINVAVALGAVVAAVAAHFGLVLAGTSAESMQATAFAFLAGALVPGSPFGHVLDYLASQIGGPAAEPPTQAELESVAGTLTQARVRPSMMPSNVIDLAKKRAEAKRPKRVPPGSFVLPLTIALGLGAGGVGLLAHGCAASTLRSQAATASTIGAAIDTACQELDAHRRVEYEHASDPDARAAVQAAYREAAAECNLAASAHDVWVGELESAQASRERGESYSVDERFALRLLLTWPDLKRLLALHGIFIGEPDPSLVEMGAAQ